MTGAVLEPFWVLHARPYRNTSALLELFSARRGRFGAIARGGRKSKSLQPFQPLTGQFGGRGELLALHHYEPLAAPLALQGRALFCGLYVNELMVRVLHRDVPVPDLSQPYGDALTALSGSDWPQDVVLRRFEYTMLTVLGYGFSLQQDNHGCPLQPQQHYCFDAEAGLQPCDQGLTGADLLAMAAGDWHASARQAAKRLLRSALAPHLGDRPLLSRELFR